MTDGSSTTVVTVRDPHDVYIGRSSIWGNPFVIGRDGTREQVIEKYRLLLSTRQDLLDRLHELKGKRLACYCKPLACHGDILAEMADEC